MNINDSNKQRPSVNRTGNSYRLSIIVVFLVCAISSCKSEYPTCLEDNENQCRTVHSFQPGAWYNVNAGYYDCVKNGKALCKTLYYQDERKAKAAKSVAGAAVEIAMCFLTAGIFCTF